MSRHTQDASAADTCHEARQQRGRRAYLAGQAAEDIAARFYEDRGWRLMDRRWRCAGGEIDLIVRKGRTLRVVEVKQSGSHRRAAESLSRRQLQRIFDAGEAYLCAQPDAADLTCSVDLATVASSGEVRILPDITPW